MMKITKANIHLVELPLKFPLKNSKTTIDNRKTIIVELHSDNNIIGYGEIVSFEDNWYLEETITFSLNKVKTILKDIIKIDLPILFGSTILLLLTTLDGKFTYIDGTIYMLFLITYINDNLKTGRKIDDGIEKIKQEEKQEEKKDYDKY